MAPSVRDLHIPINIPEPFAGARSVLSTIFIPLPNPFPIAKSSDTRKSAWKVTVKGISAIPIETIIIVGITDHDLPFLSMIIPAGITITSSKAAVMLVIRPIWITDKPIESAYNGTNRFLPDLIIVNPRIPIIEAKIVRRCSFI